MVENFIFPSRPTINKSCFFLLLFSYPGLSFGVWDIKNVKNLIFVYKGGFIGRRDRLAGKITQTRCIEKYKAHLGNCLNFLHVSDKLMGEQML